MTWFDSLPPRRLARLIGLVFLASMPVGGYALALTEGVDLSAEGLLALGGDFSSLVNTYHSAAGLDLGMTALTMAIAIGLFALLKPIDRRLAYSVMGLKMIDAGCKLTSVALSFKLASLFQAGVSADLLQAAERVKDQAWHVFHYGLAISSLGSAIMFFLLYRSRYIPRLLAGYGVLASLGVVASITAMVLIEAAGAIVYPWYVIGNGIAFIGLTGWFIIAGVNTTWWQEQQT